MEKKELSQIFFKKIKKLLDVNFSINDPNLCKNLTILLTEMYTLVRKNFVPQKYMHYIFTPSDLNNIINMLKIFKIDS